ncbi:SMI1/KNR4 family protein [Myxococcus sp. K38C18041901]|uniref:SMI1/KNR4 family protein n=1 Tax=Myxococcus guangdongensis TaxID=2906760 RepID=UPI0020A6E657|nr:SMI1/KNR4 family protein [Myxococcus guangdongensis]MCP3059018.1 SMI1/KNR4 family protein [Myxococcus guangdongensis]
MTTAKRPKDVPPKATFDAEARLWREGAPGAAHERLWIHPSGMLLLDARRKDGKLDGEVMWSLGIHEMSEHAPRLAMQKALGLPVGPSPTLFATFVEGVLVETRFMTGFESDVELKVPMRDGAIDGEVEWVIGPVDGALFELGDSALSHKIFKVPKPWPHRLKAVFAKGKLKSTAFFDKKGKPLDVSTPKLTEWGEGTKAAALAGYIERGDFAADAARFFPKAKRVSSSGSKKVRGAEAGKVLDDVVKGGGVPTMTLAFDFSSYGFDCKKEKLHGAAEAKYVGIASDGSGEMFLLDTSTGKVVRYAHEEGTVSPAFDSLDELTFALLRIEAAAKKLIPKPKLAALFKKLGLKTAEKLLKEY